MRKTWKNIVTIASIFIIVIIAVYGDALSTMILKRLHNHDNYLYDLADDVTIDTTYTWEGVDSTAMRETNDKDVSSGNSFANYDGDNDISDEQEDDPEYRKGGKYDPDLYHTDYTKDETNERMRREYIDEDGYDADDDYDEMYGYDWRQY